MKTIQEIQELKDTIKMFLREGATIPLNAFNPLFDGRAKGYVKAMSDLGQIEVDNDNIVGIIGLKL